MDTKSYHIKNRNRFFYAPWNKEIENSNNAYSYFHNKDRMQTMEDISNLFNNVDKNQKKLYDLKINTIKSMLVNQKQIPSKWILKPNYTKMLSNVIKTPKYISCAIKYNNYNEYKRKEIDEITLDEIRNSQKNNFHTVDINSNRKDGLGKANSTSKLRLSYGYDLKKRTAKKLIRGLSWLNANEKNNDKNLRYRYENNNEDVFHTINNDGVVNKSNDKIGVGVKYKKKFVLPKLYI